MAVGCRRFVDCVAVTLVLGLPWASLHAQPAPGSVNTHPLLLPGSSVIDTAGNVYAAVGTNTGEGSWSSTPGAAQPYPGGGTCLQYTPPIGAVPIPCTDAFIAKVDSAGHTVFGTYLGGTTNDGATDLAVDSAGNIYITGVTGGSFPTTPNAALPTTTSTSNLAFAAKLSADGTKFIYSTYLPASSTLPFTRIAVDAQGNAYIAGTTASGQAFVTKLSADGSQVLYTVTLGSSNSTGPGTSATAIAADVQGNAFVTGYTTSADFPTSTGVLQPHLAGVQNAFVTKLSSNGSIVFSTFLGASGTDRGNAIQVDSDGYIYVGGAAGSLDFPTTPGSLEPVPSIPAWSYTPGGFIVKLSPDGTSLQYASYVRSDSTGVTKLIPGPAGDVYIAGSTGVGFPITPSAPQPCFGGIEDVFVAHIDTQGALFDATYFGGTGLDGTLGLGQASDGSILLAASQLVFNSPESSTPILARLRFGGSGWSSPACLSPEVLNSATLFSGSSGVNPAFLVSPGQLVTLTGFEIGPESGVVYQRDAQGQAPFSLTEVQVFFDGQPVPLFYVQSRQVNAQAPFSLSKSTTSVTLRYKEAVFGPVVMPVTLANPGVFLLDPNVSTQPYEINQDGTFNSASNPASAGTIVSLWVTGIPQTDPPCVAGGLNIPGPANLAPPFVVFANPGAQGQPVPYAGSAPTLPCGVSQINLQVPAGKHGAIPIPLTVRDLSNPSSENKLPFQTQIYIK